MHTFGFTRRCDACECACKNTERAITQCQYTMLNAGNDVKSRCHGSILHHHCQGGGGGQSNDPPVGLRTFANICACSQQPGCDSNRGCHDGDEVNHSMTVTMLTTLQLRLGHSVPRCTLTHAHTHTLSLVVSLTFTTHYSLA